MAGWGVDACSGHFESRHSSLLYRCLSGRQQTCLKPAGSQCPVSGSCHRTCLSCGNDLSPHLPLVTLSDGQALAQWVDGDGWFQDTVRWGWFICSSVISWEPGFCTVLAYSLQCENPGMNKRHKVLSVTALASWGDKGSHVSMGEGQENGVDWGLCLEVLRTSVFSFPVRMMTISLIL